MDGQTDYFITDDLWWSSHLFFQQMLLPLMVDTFCCNIQINTPSFKGFIYLVLLILSEWVQNDNPSASLDASTELSSIKQEDAEAPLLSSKCKINENLCYPVTLYWPCWFTAPLSTRGPHSSSYIIERQWWKRNDADVSMWAFASTKGVLKQWLGSGTNAQHQTRTKPQREDHLSDCAKGTFHCSCGAALSERWQRLQPVDSELVLKKNFCHCLLSAGWSCRQ